MQLRPGAGAIYKERPEPTGGPRLLIVDDSALNRRIARMMLADEPYAFLEAANGREALDLLAEHQVVVVLMDVNMPVMDGIAAIQAIRGAETAWSQVAAIAMTADAMLGDRERLIGCGFSDVVQKPLDKGVLARSLRAVLAA